MASSAFRAWKREARTQPDSEQAGFVRAVKQAEAIAHCILAASTYRHALENGELGLKFLAVRYPKHWAEKKTVSVDGDTNVVVVTNRDFTTTDKSAPKTDRPSLKLADAA